jgi:hypothetical protein
MLRGFAPIAALFLTIGFGGTATAQIPNPPVIGNDPTWGPMCMGPLGPGPCADVVRYLQIMQIAQTVPVQVLGPGPQGPVCAGPMGPGPCAAVQFYIATQQFAANQIQLRQIGFQPGVGAICAGPLGPGPCDAIRAYLMQSSAGGGQFQGFNARQVQVINQGSGQFGPTCQGPMGPIPCALVGQLSIDQASGAIPSPGSFGLPAGITDPRQLAAECARRVGMDVTAFAGCAGQQVILPRNQQAVLDCAVTSRDAATFANCAAPKLGMQVSDDQRVLAGCAMRSRGDQNQFIACAGGTYLNRALTADEQAVLRCAADAAGNSGNFATCAASSLLTRTQNSVLNCAITAADATSFGACAAAYSGIQMSDDQRVVARCAMQASGDRDRFLTCAGSALVGGRLGPNEQAVLACAANAGGDAGNFAGCSAQQLLGGQMSREQQIAIQCAAESGGDPGTMAACAGANMFNLQLNPEQQIAVQCVASTGGQPYAAAGCIASRLTARELTKCLTDGIGGDGCFGDNNDLVGRNGWVRRTMGQIAGGPNSLINNPGQIWGGDNSFVRNPGQIFGGNNSFVRNPSQIWGGSNSVFNNPGQLVPRPRPVQVGSVGGHRICLPWC